MANTYTCLHYHIIRYVERQREHHRLQTFQEQYRALLDRHGISYDERYVWG